MSTACLRVRPHLCLRRLLGASSAFVTDSKNRRPQPSNTSHTVTLEDAAAGPAPLAADSLIPARRRLQQPSPTRVDWLCVLATAEGQTNRQRKQYAHTHHNMRAHTICTHTRNMHTHAQYAHTAFIQIGTLVCWQRERLEPGLQPQSPRATHTREPFDHALKASKVRVCV